MCQLSVKTSPIITRAFHDGMPSWEAVLDALDASGRADETLVFVTTDHAMPFPGAKASSFRQRTPLPTAHRQSDATKTRLPQSGTRQLGGFLSNNVRLVWRCSTPRARTPCLADQFSLSLKMTVHIPATVNGRKPIFRTASTK